ncbi:Gx transporter family protein [Peptoniphilus equinus]|uniref:Gx transporter family protein n=1 Tax=Peptoniphilus equinus TaxID=3016343 RepID=A0ABY7QVV3_9FIRM|nr:Gx transporter family protein [Peptoniphilus equinus]WBW50561.1 Gx transporter family protein [Peptoniphilus equinus]
MKNRTMVFIGLLVALGLVIGLFERMIPMPVPIPGAKLGLSNVVVLVTILFFGSKEGFIVAILKSLMLMLVTGAVTSFVFSLTGTLLSTVVMVLAKRYLSKFLSTVGISLLGSAFHNIGQILAAMLVLSSANMIYYLPVLLIIGLFTGYFVGIGADFVVKNLRVTFKERFVE